MKRRCALAALMLLASLALGASTWEGSAVVGGAGDFPGDGLYGACNSFPRDSSVEVSNLENGKSVTVVITKNVENPGVFIALSPKAAAELGMKAGSAARVRAVTRSLSMAESSLPAARAGETADPDFNPRVYVERDKSLAQERAAQAATSPVAAAAPAAPATAQAAPSAAAIIAEASAQPKAEAPAETPPPATKAAPTVAEAPATAKVAADTLPPVASASPGEPRPESLGVALPSPDAAPIPVEGGAPSPRSFPSTGPEAIGGSAPQPRAVAAAKVYLPEPTVGEPATVAAAETTGAELGPTEAAGPVLEGGERPMPQPSEGAASLSEPEFVLAPDELPEELLPRLAEPAPAVPEVALAEIDMSAVPSPAAAPTGPEALVAERPEGPGIAAEAELADPSAPAPSESLGGEKPALAPAAAGETVIALEPTAPRPPEKAGAVAPAAPAPSPAAAIAPIAPPAPTPAPASAVKAAGRPAEAPASVPLLTALARGSFYVQIGVYGSNDALLGAVEGFRSTYPLAVEKVSAKSGAAAYRLYVGPLTRDESGLVLLRIKSMGYRDAFVKQGT